MTGANKPLCSICAVGYRHAAFLEDCIKSIWANGYANKEIVALDDGSNDGSLEKLRELARESPCPMKVLEQERSGNVPRNFNRVYKESGGDFLLFISLDDMLLPDSLESKMEPLLQDENYLFVANTLSLKLRDDNKISVNITPINRIGEDITLEKLMKLEHTFLHSFYIQGAIFRRTAVKAVGAFNENMLGDDIVLRTKIMFYLNRHPQYNFRLLNKPGFIYRDHSSNLHKNHLRQIQLVLQYYDKFWPNLPNPPILKDWILDALGKLDFEEAFQMFLTTPKSKRLIFDQDIYAALRQCAQRSG